MRILTPLDLESEPTASRDLFLLHDNFLVGHVKGAVHEILGIYQSRKRLPEKLGLRCRVG
jgi:hypothetical protein